jgi:hypothetical protein
MTHRITVRINDRHVWNPMAASAEICMALREHDRIELFFDNEAPTIAETELPSFFQTLIKHGINLSRIVVITGNLKESYDHVQVEKDAMAMFEMEEFQKVCDTLPRTKNIKYHFGMLVGRCTLPRLVLASHMFSNYQEKTFQTFHWQSNSDYHRTHFELEDVVHHYGIHSVEFDEVVHLLKHAPLLKETVKQYPILHPENLYSACSWYPDFFVDVVCETWYGGNTFFLTEKFWRAVATKTPFILHGPQWILQNLKKLGFKTFDAWWDEGYSEDPPHHNIVEIKKVLQFLSNKTLPELEEIYNDMQPILDHNLRIMKNLKYKDFDQLIEN